MGCCWCAYEIDAGPRTGTRKDTCPEVTTAIRVVETTHGPRALCEDHAASYERTGIRWRGSSWWS